MISVHRRIRRLAALLITSTALSAGATTYDFGIIAAGFGGAGSLSGSFTGVDANGDYRFDLDELTAFEITFHATPGDGLYSFSIDSLPTSFEFTRPNHLMFEASDDPKGYLVRLDGLMEEAFTPTFAASGDDPKGTYFSISPVPEPSTWGLMALGLVGFAWRSRRTLRVRASARGDRAGQEALGRAG